jgi:hypothetical protein
MPVNYTPQFADAPTPKSGQTIPQQNIPAEMAQAPSTIAGGVGSALGINDAVSALRGNMTPEEAQMFALGAVPALMAPEARALKPIAEAAEDIIPQGIRAYHGSPYDFDKFDLSKIGTGEGAQAYGHGLYFAENPAVSEEYKKALSPEPYMVREDDGTYTVEYAGGGRHQTNEKTNGLTEQEAKNLIANDPQRGRMYEVNIAADPDHFLDWDKPLSEQHPKVQEALGVTPEIKGALADYLAGKTQKSDYSPETWEKMKLADDDLSGSSIVGGMTKYTYPIRDNPQSLWKQGGNTYDESLAMVGGDKSRVLRLGNHDPAYSSQALRQAGIPGIKYLDQGSRRLSDSDIQNKIASHQADIEYLRKGGADPNGNVDQRHIEDIQDKIGSLRGQLKQPQTSNFVVFDPNTINIVKKYGIAGLIAGNAAHFSTTPVDHDPFADQGMATGGAVSGKVTKVQAVYRGGTGQRRCGTCSMFVAPSSCSAVRGIISPWAVCKFWERRAAERAAGGRVEASNIEHEPTEAQKKAGNYAKDHIHVHGLDITIENAKGHYRRGVDKGGKAWSVKMPAHYGYIKGTVGKDKDHVDVYIGPHLKAPTVYIVDQVNADSRKFDEHKAFLGFASRAQVNKTYRAAFSDGRGRERMGHVTEMPVDGFKHWLENGDTTKPAKGVSTVKIDATHDGPWMSCMSIDGATMYKNKNIPATANIKGKTVDVDDVLLHHEVPEREDLENLLREFKSLHKREPSTPERKKIYLKAHNRSGTPNERAHARKIGVDWNGWSAWCRGQESKLERGPFTNEPKDADVKPIPHGHGDLEAEG